MKIVKVGSLTDRNVVTINIDGIEVTNIYTRMAEPTKPLETFTRAASTRDGTPGVVMDDFNIRRPSWQSWIQPTSVEQLSRDWA
jgi:hypothetical protein